IMLSSLCEGDRFNMIAFGNEYKLFSDRMEKYEDGVLHLARKWVESLDADMGGTEILGPIKAVYELPLDEKGCDVILLTDGAVGNHSEIINFVKNGDIDINRIPARQILFGYVHEKIIPKKRPHKILRFFTLGVGYGADENLLRSLAEINGGAMKNIHPSEKIEPAVLSLFKKTFVESIKEAKVQWNDQFSENISQLKSGLSKGQNFVHFCHLKEIPTDEVKLLLTYSDDTTDTYTAHIKTIEEDIESGLAQLYAKYTIEEKGRLLRPAQKIKLGKMALLAEQYGILSKYTSFVLTDPVLDKKYTSYEYRRIPSQMLYGMEPQFCAVYPGDFFKCMEFNSLSKTMNPLTSHNQHHPISFMKSDMVKDNNFSYTEDEENTHQKRKNQNNVLLHVITLQKASGYWENSPELQDLKFLDKELIHKITEMLIQECHVSKKIAGNVAISLFMLNLFEHRFASKKNEWEHVGKKCKNWLKKNGINEDIIQDVYQMI
ncbi:MAG: hypothetical protein KA886_09840, partial [Candidatus Cloacimonetes bacterium]|nr:hypothetical protein [Candidatus Cloacimonadota bacterium]